jgi:antitoxin (DNA-binding transcriptional repressor) of toxin-antitoxin stability system
VLAAALPRGVIVSQSCYQEGAALRFVTVRELRSKGGEIWRALREGEEAVLTINGAPEAVLVRIPEDGLEDTLRAVRRALAQVAVSRMRERASERGLDRLTEPEVEEEVRAGSGTVETHRAGHQRAGGCPALAVRPSGPRARRGARRAGAIALRGAPRTLRMPEARRTPQPVPPAKAARPA